MREITYIQAVNEALDEALATNEEVFLMGEDIGVYGGGFGATKGLVEKYGQKRIRSTPISESAIAGTAVGLPGKNPSASSPPLLLSSLLYPSISNVHPISVYLSIPLSPGPAQ